MRYTYSNNFARILAKENIVIRKSIRAKTASFNMKTRVLILPDWENISEALHDMLLVHEVGHALDTPLEKLLEGIKKFTKKYNTDVVKDYINVVEDPRVDRNQKFRYPGTLSDYALGYKELYVNDFFAISKVNDVNVLPFIDKTNLYFKNGHHLGLKFSPSEQVLIDAVAKTETFDDVLEVVDSILQYVSITESMQGKSEELDKLVYSEEGSEADSEAGSEEGSEEDSEDVSEDDFDILREAMNEIVKSNKNDINYDNIPEAVTYREMVKKIDKALTTDNDEHLIVNIGIADGSGNIVPYTKLKKKSDINPAFTKWRSGEKPNVSYMVSEFERKKAADLNKRVRVDKTGILNMTDVHKYKYSDDLFKRHDIIPEGKNHGLVFLLDWSGSMNAVLHNTLKQILTLTMFCRMTNIPFDVYIFQSSNEHYIASRSSNGMIVDDVSVGMSHSGFALKNILSSRMTANEYLTMSSFYFMLTLNRIVSGEWYLDGTPLIASLDVLPSIMNDFIKMHKVQVPTLFILTDGDSDMPNFGYGKSSSTITLNNPKTMKAYPASNSSRDLVGAMIENIKDQCGCRVIGIHLLEMSHHRYGSSFGPNGYLVTNERGYDTHYAVKTSNMNMTSRENFWKKFDKTMSSVDLGEALSSYGKLKSETRILLKSFIDDISLDRTK